MEPRIDVKLMTRELVDLERRGMLDSQGSDGVDKENFLAFLNFVLLFGVVRFFDNASIVDQDVNSVHVL